MLKRQIHLQCVVIAFFLFSFPLLVFGQSVLPIRVESNPFTKLVDTDNDVSVNDRSSHSGGKSVLIPDVGDKIRVTFSATAGHYKMMARIRSGGITDPTSFWPSGYSFTINNAITTFTPDASSLSEPDNNYGGMTWGTMVAENVALINGSNTFDIQANRSWAVFDYFEFEPVADVQAPSAITNLTANSTSTSQITLSWTAPGDDGTIGNATAYEIRYSKSTIAETTFGTEALASNIPVPTGAGTTQSITIGGLDPGTTYYFAIKTKDEVPNTSPISNVANATTQIILPTPSGTLYRAININGGALTIDGNNWEAGSTATNFTFSGRTINNQGVLLNPTTDANRSNMIRSFIWRNNGTDQVWFHVNNVPNGAYDIYVYIWEDNNPQVFNLYLQEKLSIAGFNSGPGGSWSRVNLGRSVVSDGTIKVKAIGGDAMFSGVEIYAQQSENPFVDAGEDKRMVLPTNNTTLQGIATSSNGPIASYKWTKVSGPSGVITEENSASTSATNLVKGTYVFGLTVTDEAGKTATDNVIVVVEDNLNIIEAETYTKLQDTNNNIGLTSSTILNGGRAVMLPDMGDKIRISFNTTAGDYKLSVRVRSGAYNDSNGYSDKMSFWPDKYVFTINNSVIPFTGDISTLSEKSNGSYWGTMRSEVVKLASGIHTFDINSTTAHAGVDYIKFEKINAAPVVDAGNDQLFILPLETAQLIGTASDMDGTIEEYLWTKISGPEITFTGVNEPTLSLTNLLKGEYFFRLTAKDNDGVTAFDDVKFVVVAAPTVNAGEDQVITLPVNTTTLTSTVSGFEGTITYAWSKVSGPEIVLENPTSATLSLSNLIEGVYVFKVTVSASGTSLSDEVTVTVKRNLPPVVNAGPDQTLTFPASTATLVGSATGTNIVSYAWTKVSGPTVTLAGPNTTTLTLSKLLNGTYVFRLTVKDNLNLTGTDEVTVKVLQNQTLTFGEIPGKTVGDLPFTISASVSTGLPIIYSIISGPAIISENKIQIRGAGNVVVRAEQVGNNLYFPVFADRTFTVSPATYTCEGGAKRIYVKADATGAQNGVSWADAYKELSDALIVANGYLQQNTACLVEVWVSKGTYKPTFSKERTLSFEIHNKLKLFGGFSGTEATINDRNPKNNLTILSGDIGRENSIYDNSYHVVNATGIVSEETVLDGFTITGGYAEGTGSQSNGAGLFVSGKMQIVNCIFRENVAAKDGGAIFVSGQNANSNPKIIGCVFNGNIANNNGGGLAIEKETGVAGAEIYNSTFSSNAANLGGAIYNNSGASSTKLINSTMSMNQADLDKDGEGSGGAFYSNSSTGVFTNNIIWKNYKGEWKTEAAFDQIGYAGTAPSIQYSIVQGGFGTAEDNNSGEDPLFTQAVDEGTVAFEKNSVIPKLNTSSLLENQLSVQGPLLPGSYLLNAFKDKNENKIYLVGNKLVVVDLNNSINGYFPSTLYSNFNDTHTNRIENAIYNEQNKIYISTTIHGILEVDRTTGTSTIIDPLKNEPIQYNNVIGISSIVIDNSNHLLYAPVFYPNNPIGKLYGIVEMNLKTGTKRWINSTSVPVNYPNFTVSGYTNGYKLYLDELNNILYFSGEFGIWWWNRSNNTTGVFNTNGGIPLNSGSPSLPSNLVTFVLDDKEENKFYIGTHNGLFVWDKNNNNSAVYNTSNSLLKNNIIKYIDKNYKKSLIYVVTEKGGLFTLNSKTGEQKVYIGDQDIDVSPKIFDTNVFSAYFDNSDEKLYVSLVNGVWIKDYKNFVVKGKTNYGDFTLQDGSPAIDKGNDQAVPSFLTTDFNSKPRIQVFLTTSEINKVDLGAFERDTPHPPTSGDPSDFEYSANYNGNISGIIWSTKPGTKTEKEKAYAYKYDNLNRLTDALYGERRYYNSFEVTGLYNEEGIKYDLNGNIQLLKRFESAQVTNRVMDDLRYTYQGNKLISVKDEAKDYDNYDNGFVQRSQETEQYLYDENGNLKEDKNKNIKISYNQLNLPEKVDFGGNNYILYIYDATGSKLAKEVYEDNTLKKTTYYNGNIVFEDEDLMFVSHSEGRAIPSTQQGKAGQFEYEYFLKDHLGNTRLVINDSEEPNKYEFLATMEKELEEGTPEEPGEKYWFKNLDSRHKDVIYNHTENQGDDVAEDESARLNAAQGKIIGPGIVLKVSPGDKVSMEVFAKYLEEGQNNQTTVTSIASALFGAFATGLPEAQKQIVGNALGGIPRIAFSEDNTAPRGYLNYIFFSKSYKFNIHNEEDFGFKAITTSANGSFEKLELEKIIEEEGYLYIYVANESTADVNVFFDDLKVTHIESQVKSFTDYYPFGYTIAGLSGESAGMNPNRYGYMGKEVQTEFNLGWIQTDFRFYDPQIGRFNQMDMLAGFIPAITPYQYAFNNPILTSDPSGLFPEGGGFSGFEDLAGKDPKPGKKPGENIQRKNPPKKGSSGSSDGNSNALFYYLDKVDAWFYEDNRGKDLVNNWLPVAAAFNSGSKYVTGKGNDDKDADGWDYALGWMDLIPEGAGMKLGTKYGIKATVAFFIRKAARELGQNIHHIIPKAVYRDVGHLINIPNFKVDQLDNLFPLSDTFHGNHPQYSSYVQRLIQNVAQGSGNGNVSIADYNKIINHLEGLINKAHNSGLRLNSYFEGLIPPTKL